MKKILLSIATIALVSVVAVKATGAFFTDKEVSSNNTFSAGTLLIDVLEQNSPDTVFASELLKTDWQPGEEVFVNFDVKNTGTLPLQLRGFAAGSWNEGLDPSNVKVIKIERWDGASWHELESNTSGILGYFYYTDDGSDGGSYFNLVAGDRAQLRLTVKLDDTTDDTYQGHVFTSSLQVEARQTTSGATWPI